jgi:diguanylate cyclase (GGDEF)-like protein
VDAEERPRGRVLVIDDDAAQRRLVSINLEDEGFEVKVASSGEEGISVAREFSPEAIMLDIEMPGMDGIETCRQLKADSGLASIPVLFVTGRRDDDPTTVEALSAGGNDFISKDASPTILMTRVSCQISIFRSQNKLREIAMTDELTGVFSRRFFLDALRRALKASSREGPSGLGCLLVDVDHFKKVNDTLGHLEGDETLRRVARAIDKATRETDLVGRYGGEEFVVLLPGTNLDGAQKAAENVREMVQKSSPCTVSVGVSWLPPTTADELKEDGSIEHRIDLLLQRADQAMYRAKREGRNIVRIWEAPSADP